MKKIEELKPCPFCGGESAIMFLFGHPYIRPIHTKKCRMRCDTWLIADEPIEVQIKVWNRRADNGQT